MKSQDYLEIVKIEESTQKRRKNYPYKIEVLESLINTAERLIGTNLFESTIIDKLYEISLYAWDNLEISSNILKYFKSLTQENAIQFSKKVKNIIENKIQIAKKNRSIIENYHLPSNACKIDLFDAYKQTIQENKKPNHVEIKNIERLLGSQNL